MSASAKHLLEEALRFDKAREHAIHFRVDGFGAGTATNTIPWVEVRA